MKPADLWDMDPVITSRGVVPLFDAKLDPIMENAKAKSTHDIPSSRLSTRGSARASLKLTSENELRAKFSVFPAMIKTFGPSFFIGAAMKIIYDV